MATIEVVTHLKGRVISRETVEVPAQQTAREAVPDILAGLLANRVWTPMEQQRALRLVIRLVTQQWEGVELE